MWGGVSVFIGVVLLVDKFTGEQVDKAGCLFTSSRVDKFTRWLVCLCVNSRLNENVRTKLAFMP